MTSDDSAEEDPDTVPLGEAEPVEGAPIARIAARLSWPQEKSEIDRKEGAQTIRTPNGPRPLTELLEDVETTYFARRQDFMKSMEGVIGNGPIQP